MKVVILLAVVAAAVAEPQFFYNAPVVSSPLAYTHTPYTYLVKPAEKTEEEEKKIEAIKPIVYTTPYAYNAFPYHTYAAPAVTYTQPIIKAEAVPRYHAKNGEVEHKVYKRSADAQFLYSNYHNAFPYFYNAPIVKLAEKKAEEEKPVELKAIKPIVYNTPYAYNAYPYAYNAYPYTTYAAPAMTYAQPIIKAEAVPRYHAKNGEVEHKVYKRSADAQFLYSNYYNAFPYFYNTPIVKLAEKKVEEEMKVEKVEEQKPVVYTTGFPYSTYPYAQYPYTSMYSTYAAASPYYYPF